MNYNIETLIWGLGVFIFLFLVNYFLYYKLGYKKIGKQKKKKKMKKIEEFLGFSYLIPKFKLDIKKLNLELMFLVLSFVNAFIVSVVFICISLINLNISISLLLGFVLLFALIYAIYEIMGRILVKKVGNKNV